MAAPRWSGFAEFMGLVEESDFPSFRPLILDWAFKYISDNKDDILNDSYPPVEFFSRMIRQLKQWMFEKKIVLMENEGISGQFCMHFPMFRGVNYDVPAVFINSHFAFLKDPRASGGVHNEVGQIPIETDFVGFPFAKSSHMLKGCFPIYKYAYKTTKVAVGYGDFDNGTYGMRHWIIKAKFPEYSQDCLMNLVLSTWEGKNAFKEALEDDDISTFAATRIFFKNDQTIGKTPDNLNDNTVNSRNGVVFEHIFHVAIVVASQRGGLLGSFLSEFVPNLFREVDGDFSKTALDEPSKNFIDSFDIRIPFYPSIGAELPGSLKSFAEEVCTGRFDLVRNSEKVDGIGELSNGGKLCLECKNWQKNVPLSEYHKIVQKAIGQFMKKVTSFNLHLCCISNGGPYKPTLDGICADMSKCADSDREFRKYIARRKLVFFTVNKKGGLLSLQNPVSISPTKGEPSGCDLFLVFPLKDLLPHQDFSFSSPKHEGQDPPAKKFKGDANMDDDKGKEKVEFADKLLWKDYLAHY
jgi:hypothetical protein